MKAVIDYNKVRFEDEVRNVGMWMCFSILWAERYRTVPGRCLNGEGS